MKHNRYPGGNIRDQIWLERIFKNIWEQHFHDVEVKYPIRIIWGKRARNRLGSLGMDKNNNTAIIRLTRLFQDPEVPDVVIKATIVHELCHYAHGWHSGLEQQFAHPHRGGVVRQEFAERGLEDLYLTQKRWLKIHWPSVVKKYYPHLRVVDHRGRLLKKS